MEWEWEMNWGGEKRNKNFCIFFCTRKLGRIFINGKKGWNGVEGEEEMEKQIEDEWKMSISC